MSCDKVCDIYCDDSHGSSAIVLTFDDKYIDEWYKADSIFSLYDWKATFCVTRYGELNENEKQKLQILQNNGNEIASHGYHHLNAISYLSKHSMQDYLNEEIIPSIADMKSDSLNISSFVYPGGVRNVKIDLALFDYFSVLRGSTFGSSSANKQKCFLKRGENNLLVYGLGIDNHYEHFDIDYIIDLLDYADRQQLALILYGHKIADDDTSKYVTSYNTLNIICSYAKQRNIEFLTLRDLADFNKE